MVTTKTNEMESRSSNNTKNVSKKVKFKNVVGGFQDSGEIRWGDHFLSHKFIKRSFEC